MKKEPTVKIYGLGWVGKAVQTLFPNAFIYDPQQGYFSEEPADFAIICVPTPCTAGGRLDTSIVERIVKDSHEDLIIIRSTLNPGICDRLEKETGKNIVFSPEYLGETVNHPMTDQSARPFVILGGEPENRRKVIDLYTKVYNSNIRIRQVTNYEAEVIKLSENRAIAFKVAQCQELYDACQRAGVDYYTIRDAVYGDDPRFNLWFTFVYVDKRGVQSKCLPKDVYAWAAWAESLGYNPDITKEILERNKKWVNTD